MTAPWDMTKAEIHPFLKGANVSHSSPWQGGLESTVFVDKDTPPVFVSASLNPPAPRGGPTRMRYKCPAALYQPDGELRRDVPGFILRTDSPGVGMGTDWRGLLYPVEAAFYDGSAWVWGAWSTGGEFDAWAVARGLCNRDENPLVVPGRVWVGVRVYPP